MAKADYIIQKKVSVNNWENIAIFGNKEDAYTAISTMEGLIVHTAYRVVRFEVIDEFVVEPAVRRAALKEERQHG